MFNLFNRNNPADEMKRAVAAYEKVTSIESDSREARSLRMRMGMLCRAHLDKTFIAGAEQTERVTLERIQKVGTVEILDANRVMKTGEEVFKAQCGTCHAAGLAGAPKFGDAAAWGPRIKTGYEALLTSALKGKNAMGAQGGGNFDDYEIARAVVYMANGSGAKFEEPAKPAAPAQ